MRISAGDIITIAGLVTYFAIAFAFFYFSVKRQQDIKTKNTVRFQRAMIEGFKIDTVRSVLDVINIYRGIQPQESEESSNRFGITRMLRRLMVELLSNRKNISESPLTDEQIHVWSAKISSLIEENELVSPYADLPSAERNALIDISSYVDSGDKDAAKRKTMELAGMIQVRNNDIVTMRTLNRWTLPLSIMGVALTLFFGAMAFIK